MTPAVPASKKAVVLMSGGLDSTTVAAVAQSQGFEIYALTIAYGQRHQVELDAVARVVKAFGIKQHKVVDIDLRAIGGSALTDNIDVPKTGHENTTIPVTYVPARNAVMLSVALGYAEVVGAWDIFYGANKQDYEAYVDCRPAFLEQFAKMANVACAASVEGKGTFSFHAPLIELTKAQTIELGLSLGVKYELTHSCYDPTDEGKSCGACLSCKTRLGGFAELGLSDPVSYSSGG